MIYPCNISITEARLFLFVSKAAYACFCMHENLHACVYANLHTPMLILSISDVGLVHRSMFMLVCEKTQVSISVCIVHSSLLILALATEARVCMCVKQNQVSISVCIGHSTKRQKYLEQKRSVCTITRICCLH